MLCLLWIIPQGSSVVFIVDHTTRWQCLLWITPPGGSVVFVVDHTARWQCLLWITSPDGSVDFVMDNRWQCLVEATSKCTVITTDYKCDLNKRILCSKYWDYSPCKLIYTS